ncbi:MAG: hypothetical protein ACRYG4_07395 [Janthinobacterium lividum]
MKRALALALVLAACGKQGELVRPVPAGATPAAPNPLNPLPSARLKLAPQAEPARIDDPLRKSEERRDDRFNLPPPG